MAEREEYVWFKLNVPREVADKFRAKLSELAAAQARETRENQKAILERQADSPMLPLIRTAEMLKDRGQRLSVPNLMRVALMNGMFVLDSPKNALALIAKFGLPMGRSRASR